MKKVLIVEDDRNICELMQHALEGHKYGVDSANNGTEGLKKAVESKPDLIILDVNLPGMDGWQVLEALKSSPKTSKIPVVMCTEKNMMGDIEKADMYGISGYITKPFAIERVINKVKSTIG